MESFKTETFIIYVISKLSAQFGCFKKFKSLSFIIRAMKNSLSSGFNPDGLNIRAHYKPTALQDGKAGPEELVRLIRAMGHEPENVHFRFINKRLLNAVSADGTDRDSLSTNHNDRYGDGGSQYEAMAMKEHGVYDGAYTSYLSDGSNLLNSDAGYTLDTLNSAVILYRKNPDIVSINPFKYLKVGQSPNSFGFHIFKTHPSSFFIGAISAEGSPIAPLSSAQTVKADKGIHP